MLYLCEREIGFDAAAIGFPSIGGCRALVLVTSGGLFGYHLNGNLNPGKKNAFINFITTHPKGNSQKTLYAACSDPGNKYYYAELTDIVQTLAYAGAIYWGSIPTAGSAYVHFQDINHTTCTITWRAWDDPVDGVDDNRVNYVGGPNRAIANGGDPTRMYNNVDTAGLTAVYPKKL